MSAGTWSTGWLRSQWAGRGAFSLLIVLVLALAACSSSSTSSPTATPAASTTTGGASAAPTTASGGAPAPTPSGPPREITLSIWGGPHEQILKSTLGKFEQENNAKVVYEFNNTPDRITKLNAEKGSPSYDVAVVPIDEVDKLLKDDVILPASDKVPNYDKLLPAAKLKGGYGLAQLLVGIGYNPEKVKTPLTSWDDLYNPEFKNHLSIGTLPGANTWGFLVQQAKANGGSETNLDPGLAKIAQLKPLRAFISFFPALEPQIKSGDMWVVVDLVGLMQDFKERGGPLEIVVPKEGGVRAMNVAVIPRGGKNTDLAQKLVGALISPEVQQAYAEKLFYGPVNTSVQLSPGLAAKIRPSANDKVIDVNWEAITPNKEAILERWNKEIVGR